jgi:hypothetical protein
LYRLEWEDLYTNGYGDYNDYVAYVEARACRSEPERPLYTVSEYTSDCFDQCYGQNNACAADRVSPDLKFAVSISVDTLNGGERESAGRRMLVSVATYDPGASRRVAICPSIVFNTLSRPYEWTYLTHGETYDSNTGSCNASGTINGDPICGDHLAYPNYWSVALAREQRYQLSCDPYEGTGDAFETAPRLTCGNPAPHIETYEVRFAELDPLLLSADQLGGLTHTQIVSLIHSVNLSIYEQIQVGEFHCGSGLNVLRNTSNPDVALMSSRIVSASAFYNLSKIVRD